MERDSGAQEFLRARGCAAHVVEGGIEGLVDTWEAFVELLKGEYSLGLDDLLNDCEGRQILEEALARAAPSERAEFEGRVHHADTLFITLVEPAGKCLWGEKVARERGWTEKNNWWYYMKPLYAGADLCEEIERA